SGSSDAPATVPANRNGRKARVSDPTASRDLDDLPTPTRSWCGVRPPWRDVVDRAPPPLEPVAADRSRACRSAATGSRGGGARSTTSRQGGRTPHQLRVGVGRSSRSRDAVGSLTLAFRPLRFAGTVAGASDDP